MSSCAFQPLLPFVRLPERRSAHTSQLPDRIFLGFKPSSGDAAKIAESVRPIVDSYRPGVKYITQPPCLHISLRSFGDYEGLTEDLIADACAAAERIDGASFSVAFDRIARFGGGATVLWGGPPISEIDRMNARLVDAIADTSLRRFGGHRAFEPHMTVFRTDSIVPMQEMQPITWTATELLLIHSMVGKARHRTLARWPLRARSQSKMEPSIGMRDLEHRRRGPSLFDDCWR